MKSILINELINLMCKCGCETFVGNFQLDNTTLGTRNEWTESEVAEAIHFVKYINEYFGKEEAIAIITTLVARFQITSQDVNLPTPIGSLEQ